MIESNTAITSADVTGHYDDLDLYYRLLWGDHLHHGLWRSGRESPKEAVEQLIEHVVSGLAVEPNAEVCDVGCGYGGTSRYLADHHQLLVTGITISPRQLEYAMAKTEGDNPTYQLENWESNGLDRAAFDGVVSIECIAHVVNKERYFEELCRVLKPGKRAVITAWLGCENPSRCSENWLLEPICREGRLPSMGTVEEYQLLATDAGLTVVSYEDLTRQVRKTWVICLWRVLRTLLLSPVGWRFLFSAKSRHAVFIFTVARILVAYYTGAMVYGLLVLEKPEV